MPWLFEATALLSFRPETFLLEVALEFKSFFTRIFGDESLGVIDLKHVVLVLDLFIGLLSLIPVFQCRLF